jgi:ABC-type nitrate/sulfonate/bicarbonate transport system substrate-binding protein
VSYAQAAAIAARDTHHAEQGGLAAAARAYHRDEFARRHHEIDLIERFERTAVDLVGLENVADVKRAVHHAVLPAKRLSKWRRLARIKIVAAWSNGGRGTDLLVPHDSPIQSVSDLRGRTVSPTTRGSIGYFLVVGALKKAGLKPPDVKLAFLTPNDASAAFVAGGIDAWSIWGVYRSRAVGALRARVLAAGRDNLPGLGVILATTSTLSDPAKVAIADYADRVERGYRWSFSHRDELMAWYMSFAKQDKATAALIYDEEANYHRVPVDDRLVASLQDTYATWVEAGVFKGNLDLSRYVYRDLKGEFFSDGSAAMPALSRE